MKIKNPFQPTAGKFTLLRGLCSFMPPHVEPRLACQSGVENSVRTFSPWSRVVNLRYAQLTYVPGRNDVCDVLRPCSGRLSALRGAAAPFKNTLSPLNRQRDSKLAEQLFWSLLEHLQAVQPALGGCRRTRFAFRFKRLIHVVHITAIQLMARSID